MQVLLCRVIVILVNLSFGHDINSNILHRWKMYMFPQAVCVPLANKVVGFVPCLTLFRTLFTLTQSRTETARAIQVLFD